MERLEQQHPRPSRRAAVLLAAAASVVAVFIGLRVVGGDERTALADVGPMVLESQGAVEALDFEVTVVERGWHPDVPERRYTGTLTYRAPESLRLRLVDITNYPDETWSANNVEQVVRDHLMSTTGLRGRPVDSLPGCLQERSDFVAGREPFSPSTPAPLDVVVPVGAFLPSDPTEAAIVGSAAGNVAVVTVNAARVSGLLDGLFSTGAWRQVHPTDLVELSLDAETFVLRRLTISVADSDDRTRWSVRFGFADRAGDVIFDATFEPTSTPVGELFPTPTEQSATNENFVDQPVAVPLPTWLPSGMEVHRQGTIVDKGPGVDVVAWSDGRAWLKLRTTRQWTGTRLFGDLGPVVRRVDFGDGGVGFVDPGGRTLAIHASDRDLVLTGTVTEAELIEVARSLDVVGVEVPAHWPEAEGRDAPPPGVLVPPEVAAVHVDGEVVVIVVAGPGSTGYQLVQRPAPTVKAPQSGDVIAAEVRGIEGRYDPGRGSLERSEGAYAVTLSGTGLALESLQVIAAGLDQALQGERSGSAAVTLQSTESTAVAAPAVEASLDVLLVWTSGGLPDGLAAAAVELAEVDVLTVVMGDVVDLTTTWDADGRIVDQLDDGWAIPLDVIAVDPATNQTFAQLGEGKAILTQTSSQLRRIGVGGRIGLAGLEVEIVAVVDDVSGAGAELIISQADSAAAGVDTERFLVVQYDDSRARLEQQIDALVDPPEPVRFRAPGETPFLRHGDAVLPQAIVKAQFGEFAYRRSATGRAFEQDLQWVADNIVSAEVPILGRVQCHRGIVEPLAGAMADLAERNLAHLVDRENFAGCWVPRRIGAGAGISRHAWGIAVDVNVTDNPRGLLSKQDPRLVDTMARWGFGWGGEWLVPDPSHYEYIRRTN